MDDKQILDLFWKRKEEAIAETDQKYGSRLSALARRILDSKEDAEEVLQDTLFRLWENIPPARPLSLGAYASVICRNFALSRLEVQKAKKRSARIVELTAELEAAIPGASVEAVVEERELAGRLSAAVRTLEKNDQWVFVHRYIYCESLREMADQCGCRTGVIRRSLIRIREALRRQLRE